jgi:hypothetical protein
MGGIGGKINNGTREEEEEEQQDEIIRRTWFHEDFLYYFSVCLVQLTVGATRNWQMPGPPTSVLLARLLRRKNSDAMPHRTDFLRCPLKQIRAEAWWRGVALYIKSRRWP